MLPAQLLPFDWFRSCARRVQKRFRDLGLRVSASNRFAKYEAALDKAIKTPGDTVNLSGQDLQLVHTSMLELSQADTIVSYLPTCATWLEKMQEIVGGHAIPNYDKNLLARNTQTELFFASSLRRAGLKVRPPTSLTAVPDFRVDVRGWSLGVEAKRLTSSQHLAFHCRHATKQLRRAHCVGIVAIDPSHMLFDPGTFTILKDNVHQTVYADNLSARFFREYRDVIKQNLDPTYACAVMISIHRLVYDAPNEIMGVLSGINTYWPWHEETARSREIAWMQRQIARADKVI